MYTDKIVCDRGLKHSFFLGGGGAGLKHEIQFKFNNCKESWRVVVPFFKAHGIIGRFVLSV